MSRALLLIVTIPLLLVAVAALLLSLLLDEERILAMATEHVAAQTGAELQVSGGLELSLFPRLAVDLGEVSLRMPEETEPQVTARKLAIGVAVMPLLRQEVMVDSLALDGLRLTITREPAPPPLDTTGLDDEALRAFYAERAAKREQQQQAAGSEAVLAIPLALEVAELRLTDAVITLAETGSSDTTVIAITSLRLENLNFDGEDIPLEAELAIAGDEPLALSLSGTIGVDQQTQVLTLTGLEATLAGPTPEPVALTLAGDVDLARQVADLELQASVADTRAEGTLRYASYESPQIDTRLHLNRFTPALLAIAGPEAGTAAASAPASDSAHDNPLPVDALRHMDTRAILAIDTLDWDGHVVTDLKARLRVVNGQAILPELSGTVHGGQLAMKGSLNAKHEVARVNSEGSLTGIDIASALAAASSQPVLRGSADLSWKLHGRGNTSQTITRTLQGPITLSTKDAVLVELGVEQMLCETIALVNQQSLSAGFPAESAFRKLEADIQLANGRARLQPLTAQLDAVRLDGTGALELESMDFAAVFKARVSPGLAELDPACRVNQRLTAIDWPVNCEGNTAGEPADWCAVDAEEIIAGMAGNELRRKAEKELERKFGKEAGDALRGLLGGD